ncbi:hypothetical protein [Bradyrhizobium sp. CCBAU 051011]|uniref:hypothetical protein n=1 Tax=Bradyrhizobium sp. CCBAU 051011 TaxID=858422 RepID=UPI00192A4FD7|nr:hypothetical protein [Bradyrhizobium sp. CCBAU 051011]
MDDSTACVGSYDMENMLPDIDAEDGGGLTLVAQHFSGPFSVENSPRSMRGFGGADHPISYEAWPEAQAGRRGLR